MPLVRVSNGGSEFEGTRDTLPVTSSGKQRRATTTKDYKVLVIHSNCPSGSSSNADVYCDGGTRMVYNGDKSYGQVGIYFNVPAGSLAYYIYSGGIWGIN